jgi:hypothetical protein
VLTSSAFCNIINLQTAENMQNETETIHLTLPANVYGELAILAALAGKPIDIYASTAPTKPTTEK